MVPLIPIAMAAARYVPGIVRLLKGENAGAVAEQVVGAARALTGTEDPQAAIETVTSDPEILKRWIEHVQAIHVAEIESEVEKLREINATVRAEATSDDWYVRRARPTVTYVIAFSWGWFIGSIGYAISTKPLKEVTAMIDAVSGTMPLWGIALAVIGVYVKKRSDDKAVDAGIAPPSVLGMFGKAAKS